MTPVDQTRHHDPDTGNVGDCFRCCIASILDLPAAAVPHFFEYTKDPALREDGEPGIAKLQEFLALAGLYYVELAVPALEYPAWAERVVCHYVLSGRGARGVEHSVVARAGVTVHDPNPSRGGVEPLDGLYLVGLLVKL